MRGKDVADTDHTRELLNDTIEGDRRWPDWVNETVRCIWIREEDWMIGVRRAFIAAAQLPFPTCRFPPAVSHLPAIARILEFGWPHQSTSTRVSRVRSKALNVLIDMTYLFLLGDINFWVAARSFHSSPFVDKARQHQTGIVELAFCYHGNLQL